MKKADYIAIALFVTGHCVGALLWSLYFHVASVPILYVATFLGAWYSAYRTCWWKKKNKRDGEDGA